MRERWAAWEKTVPTLPDEATVSIPYTRADMAMPSSV
jgi:hypothetical protein